jgi:hypothetical protein
LADLYAPHASSNYKKLADRFNAAATAFTAAAKVVDVEASAEVMGHRTRGGAGSVG